MGDSRVKVNLKRSEKCRLGNMPVKEEVLSPDLALTNGKIVTVDEEFSIAEAVAIKDGRFIAVGSNEEIEQLVGPKTKVINLKGRTVLPGLNDTHLHTAMVGLVLAHTQLFDVSSIKEITERLKRQVERSRPGEWVFGKGDAWEPETLKERRFPRREDLDQISPENPVVITAYSSYGRITVANSYALKAAGVTKETPNPQDGRIDRDLETGEPTGILIDEARRLIFERFPIPAASSEMDRVPLRTIEEAILRADRAFVKVGLTSATDPYVLPHEIRAYQNLKSRGLLKVRYNLMPRIEALKDVWSLKGTASLIPGIYTGFGDENLRIGCVKMLFDGGVMFKTAWMYKPYRGEPDNYGKPLMRPEELEKLILEAHRRGWSVGIHCTGEKAQDLAVQALAEAIDEMPEIKVRHCIIHGYFPTEDSLKTMSRYGIIEAIQPKYINSWGESLIKNLGIERASRFKPIRSYLDAGVTVVGGSDAPVVSYNPFLGIYAAVTRRTQTGRVLGPEERVTVEEAIKLFTINAAYSTFEEDLKGSIEPGKLADLIVLDRDILTIPPEEIKRIKVLMTIIGGEIAYRAPTFKD